MNGERRWLPRTALEAREIAEAVAPCLAEWSAAWLAGGTLVPLGTWQECGGDPVWPATRRDCGAGIALRIDPGGLRALAAAMIDRRLEEHDLRTPSDRAVIDHLLARTLDDLAQRLARFATGLTASEDGSVHVLPVGMGGEELFLIEADRSVLVALALTLAGAQRKGASLVNRSEAIGLQHVAIVGVLGSNRLLLAELEDLGVGDVLPLMSEVAAPLELAIGTARIPAGATLSLEGDHFTLQIEREPSEWRTHPA